MACGLFQEIGSLLTKKTIVAKNHDLISGEKSLQDMGSNDEGNSKAAKLHR